MLNTAHVVLVVNNVILNIPIKSVVISSIS